MHYGWPPNEGPGHVTTGSAIAFAAERLVAPVEAMYYAIASRGFGWAGPIGQPVKGVHDIIAGTVYASIKIGASAVGAAIDRSAERPPAAPAKGLVPFVNALWGDDLGRHEARLSMGMTIMTASGASLGHSGATDGATGHIVVLIHGLGQTEASWRIDGAPDLVDRVDADGRLTPLLVRYNTGRSVAANGRDLAAALERAITTWPVAVEQLTIIGHSLGGLVGRSACVAGQHADHRWLGSVADLITTGTPHAGAPAEKAANLTAWGLAFSEVTRPLATFVNRRSRGIKDLRYGAIRDTDWGGNHPDALLRNATSAHELPSHISHHVIATTVTDSVESAPGWLLGDGMVRTHSATSLRGAVPATTTVRGGIAHSSIQRHGAIVDLLMDALEEAAAR